MSKRKPIDNSNNDMKYDTQSRMSLNHHGSTQIGRTIVLDKFPITADNSRFAINSN
jgi:hypothetical protein